LLLPPKFRKCCWKAGRRMSYKRICILTRHSETVSVRLRKKLNDSIYRKLRSTFASSFWYIFHRINLELGCFIFSNSYVTSFQSPYAANISPPLKNFVKNRYKNKSQQKRKTRKSLEKSIASKKKVAAPCSLFDNTLPSNCYGMIFSHKFFKFVF
jgi:hypothetical protein